MKIAAALTPPLPPQQHAHGHFEHAQHETGDGHTYYLRKWVNDTLGKACDICAEAAKKVVHMDGVVSFPGVVGEGKENGNGHTHIGGVRKKSEEHVFFLSGN